MGLFSSKKTVHVASVTYNLAGEEKDRVNFLRTVMAAGVMSPDPGSSFGDHIVNSSLSGPAMTQRNFYHWARGSFPMGMPRASFVRAQSVESHDFAPHVPVPSGSTADIQSVAIEAGDFFYWAERHIMETRPEALSEDWTADINPASNQIVISFPDGSTSVTSADGYQQDANYLYIRYSIITPTGVDGQELIQPRLHIYRHGTGDSVLDSFISTESIPAEFYPFIPLRQWKQTVNHNPELYGICKEAYRRATNRTQHLDDLLDQIEDNEDIDKIDFCFMTYGVPLNAKDNASKRYIYEFFRRLMPYQAWGRIQYEDWMRRRAESENLPEGSGRWRVEHPPTTTIRLSSTSALTRPYDVRISWGLIDESVHTGKGKPNASVGEVWLERGEPLVYYVPQSSYRPSYGGDDNKKTTTTFIRGHLDVITIIHQTGENSYRKLNVRGLLHQNFVYDGHTVRARGADVFDDEDESEFLIPMHYPTVQRVPMIQVNQFAVHNTFLVFNSYVIHKRRWYQKGIFKVIFAVAVIAISIAVFGPGSLATSAGILGTNAGLGAALGFTGLTAALVGAALNAIAAIVVSSIVTKVFTLAFGEKIGTILGIIHGFLLTAGITSLDGFSLTIEWGNLMKAETLLAATQAISRSITTLASIQIGEIQGEYSQLVDDYQSRMKEIEKRSAELLGYSGVQLDPLMSLGMDTASDLRFESSSTFLSRTLLTGSDIAEASLDMISNFTELTLKLPDYTA